MSSDTLLHDTCSYGLNSYGLYSYGLKSCGQYSYGLYSYGLYSYGQYSDGLYSCGLYSYGLYSYGLMSSDTVVVHVSRHAVGHVCINTYFSASWCSHRPVPWNWADILVITCRHFCFYIGEVTRRWCGRTFFVQAPTSFRNTACAPAPCRPL